MHFTLNAKAGSAAVESPKQAGGFLRTETQSGRSAHRDFRDWRGRGTLDAFCAEVTPSYRRDGVLFGLFDGVAHFDFRAVRLSGWSACGSMGTSPGIHYFQRSLNRWLRARPA